MALKSADDYSLVRVPIEARRPMWEVFMIRFGAVVCLPLLMTGATIGYGMTLKDVIIATLLGVLILEIVSFLSGVAGALEGMSTSFLSRWTGFGQIGSALIGLVISITATGWFGIQNSVFAEGLYSAFGGKVNLQLIMLISGIGITLIVVYGYRMLSYVANIAVPAFIIGVLWATSKMLGNYSFSEILSSSPPGEPMTIGVAATVVAGGFMVGAVITPDLSRFNRNAWDVFWMTLLSLLLGEVVMNFIGAGMAHVSKTSDVVKIMYQLGGWFAAFLVIFSTIKINDLNLYAASLGITNFLDAVFNIKVNRGVVTLFVGLIGTVLSIMGILDKFVNFLLILGVAIPPIGGIMVVDYFILKRFRKVLEESRKKGELPQIVESINPIAILSWIIGSLIGYYVHWGIPALNSLITAGALYWIISVIWSKITRQHPLVFVKN
ncbi:purine-cytosine permease family protein [Caldanaerobacter subterraneus]|uniref:Cytosine permease n=1 Tax=Caldanaerobacter subterraneus TaxID=911092 RepID=A0A7Y2L5C2_9THEO|nr:cytosine permease [Caldanaerobacter subterraneus]NNG66093.1 cytosine permease [Caldanaerobacter subterraneus]